MIISIQHVNGYRFGLWLMVDVFRRIGIRNVEYFLDRSGKKMENVTSINQFGLEFCLRNAFAPSQDSRSSWAES